MKPVFDAHAHHLFDIPMGKTVEILKKEFEETATVKCAFLSIPQESHDGKTITVNEIQNEKCLFLKHAFSPSAYASAGLVHPKDLNYSEKTADDFLNQVKTYMDMGFDGIKMLEGYPQWRKVSGISLADKVYDKFYGFLEENNIPIIMHVANPKEYWDINKVSEHAKKVGRFCDDTMPTKEQLHKEVDDILVKFPKLKLALAHFGFMSYDISQARAYLDDHENTYIDLTPGGEQLINMSKDWDKWQKFFCDYQDRIFYGSDFYPFPDGDQKEWRTCFTRRPNFLRQFFETDTEHDYIGEKFTGVKLNEKILDKIYTANGLKFFGAPKKIDMPAFISYCNDSLNDNALSDRAKDDLKYIITAINK